MAKSKIEWTEFTWNPVTGCTKISPGCQHCYAERMAKRLQAAGSSNYSHGFEVTPHEHMLRRPLGIRKPQVVFVNSMSDLFHEDVPMDFIRRVFDIMSESPRHCYQILTKRADRMEEARLEFPPNAWMGVSVENSDYLDRIDLLRRTGASLKFISFEPLLGPLGDLDLRGIDWVIAGGESGPGARQMKEEWVVPIRDACMRIGIPFFFKQWGGVNKKAAGRVLEGRTWDERPAWPTARMASTMQLAFA